MNKIMITGNLTKDMEVKVTQKCDIGNFTVANNRGFGDNKKTTFINCTLLGKRVEPLTKYLLKGAKVLITGELEINSVKNADNTFSNYTSILVQDIEILNFVESTENLTKPVPFEEMPF